MAATWASQLAAADSNYWVESATAGVYNLVDAHTGTGTIDTCHNNKLYASSLNSSYNDPRFRTEYLVTLDMKCVETSTFCDFHTNN